MACWRHRTGRAWVSVLGDSGHPCSSRCDQCSGRSAQGIVTDLEAADKAPGYVGDYSCRLLSQPGMGWLGEGLCNSL